MCMRKRIMFISIIAGPCGPPGAHARVDEVRDFDVVRCVVQDAGHEPVGIETDWDDAIETVQGL